MRSVYATSLIFISLESSDCPLQFGTYRIANHVKFFGSQAG